VNGDSPVAILSYALWQRRFGGDSSIVGRSIAINGKPRTVVGVMPPGVEYPLGAELWQPTNIGNGFNCWCLWTIARMKPGVSENDVRRDLERITEEYKSEHGESFLDGNRGPMRMVVVPLVRQIVGDARTPLLVLLGSVALLLLIACANIANLFLARAAARQRELAVRCCLGASPRRIAAQLLTESTVLASLGAIGGILLAIWAVALVPRLEMARVPRMGEVRVNLSVLLFTIGVSLLTGLLVGIAPAVRASRTNLQHTLRDGARSGTSRGSRRLSDLFVVSQIGLSLVLLVGAGLLLRSFQRVMAIDPGYRPKGALVGRISLPFARYPGDTAARIFYDRLLEDVRAIPGVRAAGLAHLVPLAAGNPQMDIYVEGREPKPGEPVLVANGRSVSPGYFAAIGTPIVRGRAFDETDRPDGPLVAVVDEVFARRLLPNEDPIGKRFRYGLDKVNPWAGKWITIIGVAKNVKHSGLDEAEALETYQPFSQSPQFTMYLVVRGDGPALNLVPAVRARIAAIDPLVPFYEVHSMDDAVEQSLGTRRLTNVVLTTFAATALVLASLGIFGVMALNVGARRREFGVRLALGAGAPSVLALVLRQGMRLTLVGIAVGTAVALFATRLVDRLLFGVSRLDALTFAVMMTALASVALLACLIPALRATRADPMEALRG
jgi:predicted permease